MKLLSSLFALFGAVSLVSASLNCTVKAGTTVDYKACEYSSCADVGQYKGGDLIMAACRSDCSSDTACVDLLGTLLVQFLNYLSKLPTAPFI
jgi:hypothetical protein